MPPGGRGNPDNSATNGDPRWPPGRGGDCIGGAGNMHRAVGRLIKDNVISSEGVVIHIGQGPPDNLQQGGTV